MDNPMLNAPAGAVPANESGSHHRDRPKQRLLCIHGAGSSGDIFSIQLAKIRLALKDEFEFVFVNGPYLSRPGPGILPWFEGAGPYYSWFSEEDTTMDERVTQINNAIRKTLKRCDGTATMTNTDRRPAIVGLLAFSEGALAATLLLWQQKMNRTPWLPPLAFATLICCYFRPEAADYMRKDLQEGQRPLIDVPTLHVHGKQDFCLAGARRLVANHYLPEDAEIVEFVGAHHVPTQRGDIDNIVQKMLLLSRTTLESVV